MRRTHGWRRSTRTATAVWLVAGAVAYGMVAVAATPAVAATAKREAPPVRSAPLNLPAPEVAKPDLISPPPLPPDSGVERPGPPPPFDPARSTVIDSETTETKRVWRNADGTQTVELSAAPARYRDGRGNWVELDLTLVPASDGRLVPKAANNGAALRSRAEGDVAALDTPAGPVRLRHPDATPSAASVSGNVATYKGALAGRDLTLAVTAAGVEESVILPSPAASGTYRSQLVLPDGATARQAPAGVEVLDRDGRAVALFGHGMAFDAKWAVAPVLVRIVEGPAAETTALPTTTTTTAPPTTTTTPSGSSATTSTTVAPTTTTTTPPLPAAPLPGPTTVTVEVSVDEAWLGEAGRSYPVTIDPGLTQTSFATGGNDTFVLSGPTYSGTSFAGAGELWVGATPARWAGPTFASPASPRPIPATT
ncbi:MAG TPA: hypothetical protein VM287_12215 [Egibacteraceae bacterium]|nr:hypothetical protein [Egibacteraceae bacterium]